MHETIVSSSLQRPAMDAGAKGEVKVAPSNEVWYPQDMRLEGEIALMFALDMLGTFSRRDFSMVLAGVRKTGTGRELDRLIERWRRQQWLQSVSDTEAVFKIHDSVRSRVKVSDPATDWSKPWDGSWRVFSFDLPESRRKDRQRLWRQLRNLRFGFLQRSVWIWPHNVEPTLATMVEATGLPKYFCGFETDNLFLCSSRNVVDSAWDWRHIRHAHTVYLKSREGVVNWLKQCHRMEALARAVKSEQEAFQHAFHLDPLLPTALWPEHYQGPAVQHLHAEIQTCLRTQLRLAAQR